MILDKFALTDKVAIVTGPGSGIGRSTALAFAEAGAHIVAAGVNIYDSSKTDAELEVLAKEIEALDRKCLVVPTDVRFDEQVTNMVQKAHAEFGRIDILVNNAGGTFHTPFMDISEKGWDTIIRLNIKTAVLCCKAVGKFMIEQRSGSIINISSMMGLGSSALSSPYGATKAAVANLAQSLAVEWAPYNIRINAVAPGMIETPAVAVLRQNEQERFAKIVEKIALGRAGLPEEVAAVVTFLASDAASYITGQIIRIAGGEKGFGDV